VWNEPEIGNSLNTVPYNSDVMNQNSGVKAEHCHVEPIRTLLLMELTDRIGMLHDILRFFWKHDVNVTRIESRPRQLGQFDFFVDLEGSIGDDNVDKLLNSLKDFGVQKLLILDKKEGKSMNAACLCYVF
jgi:prephenate dehydratase